MPYHLTFCLPDVSISRGSGPDPAYTYETFEEAKRVAVDDLENWKAQLEANLERWRNAQKIEDMLPPYTNE